MLGTNNINTGCGNHFDPSSPVPTKSLTQYLLLSDTVSPAGSIYNLSLADNLSLVQSISDFFLEIIVDPISFTQSISSPVERVLLVSDTLLIVDSFVFSGTAGGGSGSTPIDAVFDSDTLQGMVIYVPSDGHADLAQADAVSTSGAVGLAQTDVAATSSGNYLTEGQVERTDWTSIVGTTELVPGAVYFLSTSITGGMSTIAPLVTGESIVRIGRALSVTVLDVEISQPILL